MRKVLLEDGPFVQVDDEQHPKAENIRIKQEEVNKAWEHLKSLSTARGENLKSAAATEKFKRYHLQWQSHNVIQ